MDVDASARAILSGRDPDDVARVVAIDAAGKVDWSASVTLPEGASLLSEVLVPDGIAVTAYQDNSWSWPDEWGGRWIFSMTGSTLVSSPWLGTAGETVVSPSGAIFVDVQQYYGLGNGFGGIARVAPTGSTLWLQRGACGPDAEVPPPYAFALRGTNLLLVCDGDRDDTVCVREVDENDAIVVDTSVPGSLTSDVVVAPNGHALFLASENTALSLIDVAPDGTLSASALGLTRASGLLPTAAVTSDGTFVSYDSEGLVAIAGGSIRWRAALDPKATLSDLVVDRDGDVMIATSATVSSFDGATGSMRWSFPLPSPQLGAHIAPAGPRALYVRSGATLTRLAD